MYYYYYYYPAHRDYILVLLMKLFVMCLGAAVAVKEEAGLSMKVDGKSFYFAVGDNRHGTHLRISEVSLYYICVLA